jgi:hypothetical protein
MRLAYNFVSTTSTIKLADALPLRVTRSDDYCPSAYGIFSARLRCVRGLGFARSNLLV